MNMLDTLKISDESIEQLIQKEILNDGYYTNAEIVDDFSDISPVWEKAVVGTDSVVVPINVNMKLGEDTPETVSYDADITLNTTFGNFSDEGFDIIDIELLKQSF